MNAGLNKRYIMIVVAMLCVTLLAACNDAPQCDIVCHAKQQAELQSINANMTFESSVMPFLIFCFNSLLFTLGGGVFAWAVTLFVVGTMWLMRVYGFGRRSDDERTEYLIDAQVAIETARLLAPPNPAMQYVTPDVTLPSREFAALPAPTQQRRPAITMQLLRPQLPLALSGIAAEYRPPAGQFLIALDEDREPITLPENKLPHIGIGGATGGGKSSITRLLLPQYIANGYETWLLNPHFMPVEPGGEDWQVIARYAHVEYHKARIVEVLREAAEEELPRRMALLRDNPNAPLRKLLYSVDELISIIDYDRRAAQYLSTLLREGRKYLMTTVSSFTDALVRSLQISGPRDCWRTSYYVGGDATTARVLLDLPPNVIDESHLGKGRAMLRCAAFGEAKQVIVPFADNDGIERWLDGIEPLPQYDDDTQQLEMPKDERPTIEQKVAAMVADGASIREVQDKLGLTYYRARILVAAAQGDSDDDDDAAD